LWARSIEPLPEEEGVGYVKIVPGNRVVTVPKNYKTDRTIAIEPDMNIYVQLGIGAMIRRRLKTFGVDLNDQSVNQRLALEGSFRGQLATIDMSMASDTICRVLVEKLLPSEWCDALGQCRSPYGVLPDGKKIFYQKYSSMGNGFTFELESLIFWALARAVVDSKVECMHGIVSVYGDDVILPCAAAADFMAALKSFGFKPNDKKSHVEGLFRESCGKHYLMGYDVTPFYVKRAPETLVDLFKIHNQIWRYIDRSYEWMRTDQIENLRGVCSWLRSYAPSKWRRPSIVDGIGDGGFVGYFDEVLPQRAKGGWDGYMFKTMLSIPQSEDIETLGLLIKILTRYEKSSSLDPVTAALVGLEPEGGSIGVYPVTGTRYREGAVFVPSHSLRKLSTGLFYR
jgi:hypothetical protein